MSIPGPCLISSTVVLVIAFGHTGRPKQTTHYFPLHDAAKVEARRHSVITSMTIHVNLLAADGRLEVAVLSKKDFNSCHRRVPGDGQCRSKNPFSAGQATHRESGLRTIGSLIRVSKNARELGTRMGTSSSQAARLVHGRTERADSDPSRSTYRHRPRHLAHCRTHPAAGSIWLGRVVRLGLAHQPTPPPEWQSHRLGQNQRHAHQQRRQSLPTRNSGSQEQ